MNEQRKTKKELLTEIAYMCERVAELETAVCHQKQPEKEARNSEARYRSLSEATFEAIFISEKGVCLEQNLAAEKMFGYSLSEAVGQLGTEWIAPQDRALVTKNALSGYEEPYEVIALRKDGSTFSAEIRGKMMEYNGRSVQVTVLNDITKWKQTEAALRKSEEAYRLLSESARDMIFIHDMEGRLCYANAETTANIGYDREEVIGMHIMNFVYPDDRAAVLERGMARTQGDHQRKIYEIRFLAKNDDAIPIEVSSSPIKLEDGKLGILIVARDITERKQAEQALKSQAERLHSIIEGTNVGTWEWNVQSGEAVFNEKWANIIGYTLAEISPVSIETWMKYAHPNDLKESDALLQKHFNSELDYYHFESRMKHKNGHWIWVLDRGKIKSWTEDGKPEWIFGTHQEITEQVEAKQALKKLNAELDERVRERTADLNQTVQFMAGREVRMAELKRVIQKLRKQLQDAGINPVANDPLLGS